MAFFSFTTCFMIIALVAFLQVNGQYNNQPTYGNTFSNVANTMLKGVNSAIEIGKNVACVSQHEEEFKKCNERMDKFSGKRKETLEVKELCCTYVAYRECIESVSKTYCGDQTQQTIEDVMNEVKAKIISNDCNEYSSILQCMDQVVLVAIVLVLALVGLGIIVGLVCVCKSCCC